jgi:uroporphyrinogen decarboxylase
VIKRHSPPRYRELLTAVLAGAPVPICPVFAHQHHPAADQDGERLAEATLAWQARFDFDLAKLTPASTWQIRDYGVEDAPDPDDPLGRRRIVRRVVAVPGDWLRLPRLDPGRGFAAGILRAAALVRRALPGVPVVATVYSPASQAVKLAGPDRLADHVREAPDVVALGLRTITGNTVRLIGALADAGIDGVFLAVQNAQAAAFTAAEYAGLGLPGDRASLEAARVLPFNILHLHGDGVHCALFEDRPPVLLHLEAAPGNPAPETLLARGGLASGPSPWGAISTGSAVEAFVEAQALLVRLKGPRFMLAPGCTLPLAVPAANLQALIAAARTPRPDRQAPERSCPDADFQLPAKPDECERIDVARR